jgi:hypothetical protein
MLNGFHENDDSVFMQRNAILPFFSKVRWKLADKCCKLHGMLLISLDDEDDEDYEFLSKNIHSGAWNHGQSKEFGPD